MAVVTAPGKGSSGRHAEEFNSSWALGTSFPTRSSSEGPGAFSPHRDAEVGRREGWRVVAAVGRLWV